MGTGQLLAVPRLLLDNRTTTATYQLNVKDVPVDGLWSITLYNAGATSSPTSLTSTPMVAAKSYWPPPSCSV